MLNGELTILSTHCLPGGGVKAAVRAHAGAAARSLGGVNAGKAATTH